MTIHETAWIAPGAHVSGDVTIGPRLRRVVQRGYPGG